MTTPEFKDMIYGGMKAAFERDGQIRPMGFFLIAGNPVIVEIPMDFMENYQSKSILANGLKKMCQMPGVEAGAFVTEAYVTMVDENTENAEAIKNGDIRVSDLENKNDIIMMVFSTPIEEVMIGHFVNPEEKTIGEKLDSGGVFKGMFSGFFKWCEN